jgi:hypothetical protein
LPKSLGLTGIGWALVWAQTSRRYPFVPLVVALIAVALILHVLCALRSMQHPRSRRLVTFVFAWAASLAAGWFTLTHFT